MKFKTTAALVTLSLLSGCVAPVAGVLAGPLGAPIALGGIAAAHHAENKNNMPRATAAAIGQNVAPEDVKVYDVHQPALGSVRWMAQTPAGQYSCSADGNLHDPYCVKK